LCLFAATSFPELLQGHESRNPNARSGRAATCAVSETGFLRVSMSAAYGASYSEARAALEDLVKIPTHLFLEDATTAACLPANLGSRHDITDAHLVTLASRHGLRLTTLDEELCRKEWAQGIAVNPLTEG
jgi:predicted nucleic acid-binding protein